jgi:hypothetical protein
MLPVGPGRSELRGGSEGFALCFRELVKKYTKHPLENHVLSAVKQRVGNGVGGPGGVGNGAYAGVIFRLHSAVQYGLIQLTLL